VITAVVFDLFETLITESGTQPDSVSAVAPRLGCETRPFRKEWKAIRPAVIIGTCSFREALRAITTRLGCPPDEHTLERLSEERARIKARPFALIEPQVLLMVDRLWDLCLESRRTSSAPLIENRSSLNPQS
jgi:hypothetical protein